MPTVKLSTKNTTASLDDSTQTYQVTGSTKADKVLIYPEVNVSSMDLKAGNDAIHLPYDLSEYTAKINKTTLILTASDNSVVKMNIGASQTDTLLFADGFVNIKNSRGKIAIGNLTLQANKFYDLTNENSIKFNGSKTSESAVDNSMPMIQFKDQVYEITEGDSSSSKLLLNLTREGNLTQDSTVKYTVDFSNSDAIKSDFSGKTEGTVTFKAGQASKTITLNIKGDKLVEGDEAFDVVLSAVKNAELGDISSVTPIILDNDVEIVDPTTETKPTETTKPTDNTTTTSKEIISTLNVSQSASQTEEGDTIRYTLDLDKPNNQPISVDYKIIHKNTDNQDFESNTTGSVIFNAGETSKVVNISTKDDTLFESDENFDFQVSSNSNVLKLANSKLSNIILNDDAKPISTIGFSNTNLTQSENAGNFNFTVTRSGATDPVSVNYALSNVSTDSNDFTGNTSGTLSFAQGETSKTISIAINNDSTYESDENFKINLTSSDANVTLNNATATGTITNDDAKPKSSIGFSNTLVTQAENAGKFTFTVTRSGSTEPISLNYALSHDTTDANDFTGITSGTISFGQGETSKTISIDINNDSNYEADENFKVNLTALDNSTITLINATATGTITNDDAKPKSTIGFSNTNLSQSENAGNFSFTVTRSGATDPASVDYVLSNVTTDNKDFTGFTSGTLSFGKNEVSKTISIAVNNDSDFEADESFKINLTSSDSNVTLSNSTATGTITNDDKQIDKKSTIGFSQVSLSQSENAGDFNLTINRSGSTDAVTVNYEIVHEGTYDGDFTYRKPYGSIYFATGETSKSLVIPVLNDSEYENDETFKVNLDSNDPNVTFSTQSFTGTITNDDARIPYVSFDTPELAQMENAGNFNFIVSRDDASSAISVNYNLEHYSTNNDDFTGSTSGTLRFAKNEFSKTISIAVKNDNLYEIGEDEELNSIGMEYGGIDGAEVFQIRLDSPDNVMFRADRTLGYILNDDAKPISTIGFSNTSLSQSESAGNFNFTVTRSGATDPVSVNYDLSNVSTDWNDFTGSTSGIISFGQGETSKTISIAVNNDSLFESDESFTINLTSYDSNNVKLSNATATGTITNDDLKPTIGFSNTSLSQSESAGNFNFTVTRSGATSPISVYYSFYEGTTNYYDFTEYPRDNQLYFGEGETSKTITVPVKNDDDFESDESFTITLNSYDSNITFNNTTATGTITNDDKPFNTTAISQVEGLYQFSADNRYAVFSSGASLIPNNPNTSYYSQIYLKDLTTGAYTLVSANAYGMTGNNYSYNALISNNGRYVTFASDASNLVNDDGNNRTDWFRKDVLTNDVIKYSEAQTISNDGDWFAFNSNEALVSNDTNTSTDVFIKNINTGEVKLVSSTKDGVVADGWGNGLRNISKNANFVLFSSVSSNLTVDSPQNWSYALYLKNTQTNDIKLVNVGNDYNSTFVSNDGRYVFFSTNQKVSSSDSNSFYDIYLKDMQTGDLKIVSTNVSNQQANGDVQYFAVSDNSRYVVFSSSATNLVSNDNNYVSDVFVKDLNNGNIKIVSMNKDGVLGNASSGSMYYNYVSISPDGRYISFTSDATNLTSKGTSGTFVTPNPLWSASGMQKQLPLELSLEVESTVGQPLGWNSTVNLNPNQFNLNTMTSSLLNTESILGNTDKNYLA